MYSRKMVQSSKQRVLKVTWERCCDLAWKASRRSLHRDHTSVLARDVQGAKATPNRGRGRQGAQARKNWPPRLHENPQCFVTCQKELKMSGCISEKKSGCISEKKLGCISDPHASIDYLGLNPVSKDASSKVAFNPKSTPHNSDNLNLDWCGPTFGQGRPQLSHIASPPKLHGPAVSASTAEEPTNKFSRPRVETKSGEIWVNHPVLGKAIVSIPRSFFPKFLWCEHLQYVTPSPHKQSGQKARQAQCWPPHLQSFDPSDSSIVSFQEKKESSLGMSLSQNRVPVNLMVYWVYCISPTNVDLLF